MAYLRAEKENIEISFSIKKTWAAIPKAITTLQWKIEEVDEKKHHLRAKTAGGFLSYSSDLLIDLSMVDEKTTRMVIKAETPVTTITSIADFGRTRDRIEMFVDTLARLINS